MESQLSLPANTEFTAANTPAFGFVDITEDEDANSVNIISADVQRSTSLSNTIIQSMRSVINVNRANGTLEFIGVDADGSGQGDIVAGKASNDYYFRAEWTGVNTTDFSAITSSPTTSCVSSGEYL